MHRYKSNNIYSSSMQEKLQNDEQIKKKQKQKLNRYFMSHNKRTQYCLDISSF